MATNRNGMIELGGLVAPSGKMIRLAFLERRAAAILPNRPDLAQEAVQEAALRLLHVAGANEVLNPESYAAQVIRSAAFDLLREEYRQRRLQEDAELQNEFATVLQSEVIDRWLFAVQILKAIRCGLGGRQYDVANLVYQGCTVAPSTFQPISASASSFLNLSWERRSMGAALSCSGVPELPSFPVTLPRLNENSRGRLSRSPSTGA